MSHDTGQLDISDRLTMASNIQPKASEWTEIGQAEVIHTIFGNAKVRIVRKHDKFRRIFFLLATMAIVVVFWESWVLIQQYAPVLLFNSSSNDNVSFSVSPPEKLPQSDSSMMMKSKENSISEKVINTPDVNVYEKPAQPQSNINGGKVAAKQVAHLPLNYNKPQSASLAASNMTSANQVNKIQLPNQVAKPFVQKSPISVGVVQLPAANTATAVPLEVPPSKEDVPPDPVGENQNVDPASSKQ